MGKSIKLLDVTLRDGGYKTNFHFQPNLIDNTLTLLDKSGIDYIEVGYRNGPFKLMPDAGKAATSPRDYLEYCRKKIQRAQLTVILHPKNIQPADLAEMKACGVDAIRICFSAQNPAVTFHVINMAKQYNFEVFINITRVSHYHAEQIRQWISELERVDVKIIYLADSNGSLTPDKVSGLFRYLYASCSAALGFHAHDNLFLAQANALAAIKNGAEFIDASLCGLGKGAGNLRTEGIVSFLHAEGNRKQNVCKIIEAASYIKHHIYEEEHGLAEKDIILGIFDLSQDDAGNLSHLSDINDYYLHASQYFRDNRRAI